MCKSTPYIQSVVQCASVNTLAAIAFDRQVYSFKEYFIHYCQQV